MSPPTLLSYSTAPPVRKKDVGQWWSNGAITPGNVFAPRIAEARVGFEDPKRTLLDGADLQTFILAIKKSEDRETHPTLRVDLMDSRGVILDTVIEDEEISSLEPIVLQGSWDAALLEDPSGTSVRAHLTSLNKFGETYVDLAAIRWKPKVRPRVTRNLILHWRVAALSTVGSNMELRWKTRSNVASQPLTLRWKVLARETTLLTWGETSIFWSDPYDFQGNYLATMGDTTLTLDRPYTLAGVKVLGNDAIGVWFDFANTTVAGNDTSGFWIDEATQEANTGTDESVAENTWGSEEQTFDEPRDFDNRYTDSAYWIGT